MIRPFRPIKSPDRILNQVQDAVSSTLNPVVSNLFLNGKLLKSVALVAGDNAVAHPLGRPYITYFLGQTSAVVSIFAKTSPNSAAYAVINASAPATVDLFFV